MIERQNQATRASLIAEAHKATITRSHSPTDQNRIDRANYKRAVKAERLTELARRV